MECLIEAIIPLNYIEPWNNKNSNRYIKNYGKGFIVSKNKKLYVITAKHIVNFSDKINVLINRKKYSIKNKNLNICDNYDLVLCELNHKTIRKNINIKTNYLPLDLKSPSNDDRIYTYINDEKKYLKFNDVMFVEPLNTLYPKRIFYDVIFKDETVYESKIKGFSGSPVYINNNIIGIIAHNIRNSKRILVVPSKVINRLLNELIKKNKLYGICNLATELIPADTEFDERMINTLFVNKNHINYNKYIETPEWNGNILKNKDMIVSIIYNDVEHSIIECNKIYDNELEIPVLFNVFVSLNYMSNDKIILKILREKKDDYNYMNINIKANPIKTMINMIDNDINKIQYYKINDIIIINPSLTYLKWLYDLKKNNLYETIDRDIKYTRNKLIFVIYKNKYYKLNKINNKKTNNIQDILMFKKNRNIKSISMLDEYNTKINIKF